MNRKFVTLLTMLLLVFPLLAACGGGEEATPADTGAAPGEETIGPARDETVPPNPAEAEATEGDGAATTEEPEGGVTATTGAGAGAPTGDKTITVGSKNFTEQFVLGELYAGALEAKGYKVTRKLNLGSEQIADRALATGQIDVYPEYTGTMLTILKIPVAKFPKTPEATYALAKKRYAARKPSITLLEPAAFENTYGIPVSREAADRYNLKTLADLQKAAPNLVFASYSEFQDRQDGLPNLKENYPGIEKFKDIQIVNDLGLRYKALLGGQADVGVGFTTDGQLADEGLVVLEDPKRIWPPYYPTPVLKQDFLDSHPDVAQILNQVTAKLTVENMRELNAAVDLEKEEPIDVAQAWLEDNGLAGE